MADGTSVLPEFAALEAARPGVFRRAITRGGYGVVSNLARAGEGVAAGLGLDGVKDAAGALAQEYDDKAQSPRYAPRVRSLADAQTVGDYAELAAGALGENLPNALTQLAFGLVASRIKPLAGALGRTGAAVAGAAPVSLAANYGEIYGEQRENGVDRPADALVPALATTALDLVGPGAFFGTVFRPAAEVARKGASEFAGRVLKGVVGGAAAEAPTEYLQERIAIGARGEYDPAYPDTAEAADRALTAGFGGGVVGGVFGGGAGALRSTRTRPPQPEPSVEQPFVSHSGQPAAAPVEQLPAEPAQQPTVPSTAPAVTPGGLTSEDRQRAFSDIYADRLQTLVSGAYPTEEELAAGRIKAIESTATVTPTPQSPALYRDPELREQDQFEALIATLPELRREPAPTTEPEDTRFVDLVSPASALERVAPIPLADRVESAPVIAGDLPVADARTAALERASRIASGEGAVSTGFREPLVLPQQTTPTAPAPIVELAERFPPETLSASTANAGRVPPAPSAVTPSGLRTPSWPGASSIPPTRLAEESPREFVLSSLERAVSDETASSGLTSARAATLRRKVYSAVKAAPEDSFSSEEAIRDTVAAAVRGARGLPAEDVESLSRAVSDRIISAGGAAFRTPGEISVQALSVDTGAVTVAIRPGNNPLPAREQRANQRAAVSFTPGRAVTTAEPGGARYVQIPADKVYDATRFDIDPLYKAARASGADTAETLARYQRSAAELGYDAMLLPGGEVRVFSAPEGVSLVDADIARVASRASGTHRVYGASATSVSTGADMTGTPTYFVPNYPTRTAVLDGDPSGAVLSAFAREHATVLLRPDAALLTRSRPEGVRVEAVATTDSVEAALLAARDAGVDTIVDGRTMSEIPVGHPVFDTAAEYAQAVGRVPPQAVDYAPVSVDSRAAIDAWMTQPAVPVDAEASTAYEAYGREVDLIYARLSRNVSIEPWADATAPYATPADAARDLFSRRFLFVRVPPAHPAMPPDRAWRSAAVREVLGASRVGFDRSLDGRMNAAKVLAQTFSEAALPAAMTEAISPDGQYRGLAPESLWRPATASGTDAYSRAVYRAEQIDSTKGAAVLEYLTRILGARDDLEIQTFNAGPGRSYSGRYARRTAKDLIEVALNRGSPQSIAAHEAFHFLEQRVLTPRELRVVERAFAPGTDLYVRLIESVKRADASVVDGASIAEEIENRPEEARAYGFEAWRRGELEAAGPVGKIFDRLRSFLARIANFVRGLGFQTAQDVFVAIDRGAYATRRNAQIAEVGHPDNQWALDVEDDVVPRGQIAYHGGRKHTPKGRPHWVKSGGDVQRLRARLRSLARDGAAGRDWHYRSSAAILSWAKGDRALADMLARLIATYSPRTPVGQDLVKALLTVAQHRAGVDIDPGAPGAHIASAKRILAGEAEVTGEKRSNFYRNLMRKIDPDRFGPETQGATIDMWMAHAFGFAESASGAISSAQYNYANAEVQRTAREMGWSVEETQAAIWIATKGRMAATRSFAAADAARRGWVTRETRPLTAGEKEVIARQGTLFGTEVSRGRRVSYVVKREHERDHVMNWVDVAMRQRFTPDMFDFGNYSYFEAFRDIASGRLRLSRAGTSSTPGVAENDIFSNPDDTRDLVGDPPRLELFSKAAYAERDRWVQDGNFSREAQMHRVAELIKSADVPEENVRSLFGRVAQGGESFVDAARRKMTAFVSGEQMSRNSAAYGNGHRALTAFDQRKKRLISQATEQALASWKDAPVAAQGNVSNALLDRTMASAREGSAEYNTIRERLSQAERRMFDDATKMVRDQLVAEFEADRNTYVRLLGASSRTVYDQWVAAPNRDEFYRGLPDGDRAYVDWVQARDAQVNKLIDEGYFPERRYGDHAVTAYYKDPASGRRVAILHEQFESKATARARLEGAGDVAGLKQILSSMPNVEVEYAFKYTPDVSGTVSFARFVDMASNIGIALNQSERERVARALIAADSARNNRVFRRENVPGASTQGLRVLSELAVSTASKIAYAELSPAIDASRKGYRVETQFMPDGTVRVAIDDRVKMWDLEGPRAGFYRTKLDEKINFVLAPRESSVSTTLRTMATMQFLGGSFAAAAVQLTSLPMIAAPALSQYTSITDANAKLFSAASWAATNGGVISDLRQLDDRSVSIPYLDNTHGLRDAMIVAAQDGTIIDTEIYEVMGLSRGQVGVFPSAVRKAMEKWMTPFRWSERTNRAATFIAAYRIGLDKNLAGKALYDFAQQAVYDTQFRYDEVNRPAIAHSPVGMLLMTFKTFPIYATEMLVKLGRTDKRAAAYMLLALFAFAGAEGLPFADDIMDIVDGVSQKVFGSPFSARRAVRNMAKDASEALLGADLSSIFMRGTANWLTGASIASRVGLGNLIPGTRILSADADFKKVGEEVLGPAFAAAVSWGGFADPFVKGDLEGALRNAPFLAVQNATKGVTAWSRGYAEDKGGRKVVDLSGWEAAMQAIGFTSNAATAAYDLDRIDREQKAFYLQTKRDIIGRLTKAINLKDDATVSETIQFVARWNEKNPDMPISITAQSLRRSVALAGLPVNERTLRSLPRALRGQSVAAELAGEGQP